MSLFVRDFCFASPSLRAALSYPWFKVHGSLQHSLAMSRRQKLICYSTHYFSYIVHNNQIELPSARLYRTRLLLYDQRRKTTSLLYYGRGQILHDYSYFEQGVYDWSPSERAPMAELHTYRITPLCSIPGVVSMGNQLRQDVDFQLNLERRFGALSDGMLHSNEATANQSSSITALQMTTL